MNRKTTAAAVLAALGVLAAGAAQAQSSVTLYGIVDLGLGYQKIKGQGLEQSRTGLIDGVQSGSRWGLRGSEDLGNGLRAVFQLESGFNPRTGRSLQGERLFGRQATVGLAGDSWGQLLGGRKTNITSEFFASIDPFAAAFGQANIGTAFSAANTVRWDNQIQYQTPSIGGFQLGVGYSFDINETANAIAVNGNTGAVTDNFSTNQKNRGITAGLRYVNGPLNLAASYDQVNRRSGAADAGAGNPFGPTGDRIRSWMVGGSFDFEVVKLALAYGQTRDGWFGSPGLQSGQSLPGTVEVGGATVNLPTGNYLGTSFREGSKVNSYLVGLTAPLGPGSLFGSWQRADPSNDRLTGDDATLNVYSLGYTYDLSKRTNLYAYGSYAKNYAFLDDVKSQLVGVGVRHRF
ncbi:porin [Orrella sp. JC864]|uniref:porin n=1 Tax=Orrella sp. JC864 TaxID=3120298 RepID=UPI0030081514